MIKKLKTSLIYFSIFLLGISGGYLTLKLKSLMSNNYVEGDYQRYFGTSAKKIMVYGTETCPYCKQAREYFLENTIQFEAIDVDTSEKGRADFASLGVDSVPIILIGNRMISGFDVKEIDAALAKIGIAKKPMTNQVASN